MQMDETRSEAGESGTKIVRGVPGLALIAVLMPTVFWLRFGFIDGYAIGFTAFLVLLAAAVEYLPRQADEAVARGLDQRPAYQRRWYDMLGVVWLLSIPFAPLLAWTIRNLFEVDRANWTWLLGASAVLCVVVPLVCVLPLLRFLRRGTAGIALTILAIGTGFPVATGLGPAYDVLSGPAWQDVTIDRLEDVDFRTSSGTHVHNEAVFAKLADGRRLTRAPGVRLREGPARLLVLRGYLHVIAAAP